MNNVLNKMSEIIVERVNGSYEFSGINEKLDAFLNSGLDDNSKAECMEELYLFVLYKDGYVSADPRYKEKLIYKALKVLNVNELESFETNLNELKDVVNIFMEAETKPLTSIAKMLDDLNKNSNVMF